MVRLITDPFEAEEPGSRQAQRKGCSCPELQDYDGKWIINKYCTLHGVNREVKNASREEPNGHVRNRRTGTEVNTTARP